MASAERPKSIAANLRLISIRLVICPNRWYAFFQPETSAYPLPISFVCCCDSVFLHEVLELANVLHLRIPPTHLQIIILLHASLESNQPPQQISTPQLFADFALGDYLSRAATRYAFSPTL